VCCGAEGFELLKNKVTTSEHIAETGRLTIGEHGLLAVDGSTHQRMRGLMNPPFTPRGLGHSGIGVAIAELVERRVASWAQRRRITILQEVQDLALDIVFRIVEVQGEETVAWRKQYRRFMLSLVPVPFDLPGFPRRLATQARRWLDDNLRRIIEQARGSVAASGLVGEMVAARDENGQRLSDEELIDNLRLLMLAGHETTASTLAFMMITLAQRGELWDALCSEVGPAAKLPLSPQEARGFPFAEALFRETLRLYPPVAMTTRRTTQPIVFAGHQIPAGEMVYVPLVQMSRDPKLYQNPARCEPGRWLGRSGGPSPIEIAQFGGGPHFCLGYHLALFEAVQFGVALVMQLGRRGLRPRLGDGPAPRAMFMPLTHPTSATQIELVG
jgi:cytochrome P450 monooxygenase